MNVIFLLFINDLRVFSSKNKCKTDLKCCPLWLSNEASDFHLVSEDFHKKIIALTLIYVFIYAGVCACMGGANNLNNSGTVKAVTVAFCSIW